MNAGLIPDPAQRARIEAAMARTIHVDPQRSIALAELIAALQGDGLHPYVVGGAVRDWIRDMPERDIDMAIDYPLDTAHERLRRAFPGVDPVSRKLDFFGVMRWGEGPLGGVDINIFRDPSAFEKIPLSMNTFTAITDIDRDVMNRDFTINALYYDPDREVVLDPSGRGLDDIRDRVLRINAHPLVRRSSNRLSLRVAQFIGRGFIPTEETIAHLADRIDVDIPDVGVMLPWYLIEHGYHRPEMQAELRQILARYIRSPQTSEQLERAFAIATASTE